jgi:hypothetical protein
MKKKFSELTDNISFEESLHNQWIENVDKEIEELEHLKFNCYPYPTNIKRKDTEIPIKYGKELFPLFNCINIETTSWCNMNCPFCPSIYINREKRNMKNDLFINIAKELSKMQYTGEIRLHQSNEPLTDKHIFSKIKYMKLLNPKAIVGIHSNTILLNYKKLVKLYKSGLNFMAAEAYKSEAQFDTLYEMFLKLEKEYDNVILHTQDKNGTYSFTNIKQNNYKNKGLFITLSRRYPKTNDDKFFNYNKSKITSRIGVVESNMHCKNSNICTRPFRTMQVNFNGKTVVCCEEWLYGDGAIIGDLNKNSIVEIWNGLPIMKFRYNLQNKNRNTYPCNKCNFPGGIFTKMIRKIEL